MSNEVIIKSNRYGIRLILNDQLPFEELTSVVANKFQEISDFFKDAKMAVSFEERTLTLEEEVKLTEIIMEHSNIQVISIIDHDKEMEEQMRRKLQNFELSMQQQFADSQQNNTSNMPQVQEDESHNDFYKGNLRSGQTLESNSSITIIGDVNPGAKVISAGNIVILGSLKGNAHAGAMGDTNCFILALEM